MIDTTQVHRKSIIIDGLNASNLAQWPAIERLQAGGLTAVHLTIAAWHTPTETLHQLARLLALLDQYSSELMPVQIAHDIVIAKELGRVGVIAGFQGTEPIAEDLRWLSRYYRLGVRVIQLTYNFRNRVGAGCYEPDDGGLTPFGRDVVAEMNRLGMLIDLSHCGLETARDAIELSQQPVALTHANARAVCANLRNKTDEVLKAVAERGGVIGAAAFGPLLTESGQATLDDYVRMIDYLVNLVGIDHVGLGPDFMENLAPEVTAQVLNGLSADARQRFANVPPTAQFESAAAFGNITAALLQRGYPRNAAEQLLGGNWLRLYRQVWK